MSFFGFGLKKGVPTTIKKNEQTRNKWDIQEEDDYEYIPLSSFGVRNVYYKVHTFRQDNMNETVTILFLIDKLIQSIQRYLHNALLNKQIEKKYISACQVFIETPHTVQECHHNSFHGINKPKEIIKLYKTNNVFKKDNWYRATYRHVMLTLRTKKTGELKPWSYLKNLLLHELAHTMCNHITYREEGNHEKDFDDNERFITNLVNTVPELKSITKEIENFIRNNK